MGGKKKLGLKQMERTQSKQDQEKEEKKAKSGGATGRAEKKAAGINPPDPKDEKIIKELQKMSVLTPHAVASRFNLRLSVAKDFLEELNHMGIITFVSSGRNLKIYKPSAS